MATEPRILIVDNEHERARRLRDEISSVLMTNPIHRDDGESAVLWAGANDCDLCIISYELPGIDGLETLARIRNRIPGLPAIMVAKSQDQHVAIAAFRAGFVDFIPVTESFARLVTQRVQATIDPENASRLAVTQALEDPTLSGIPPDRLHSTYQNRLRTIGRQLDIYQYYSVIITEVEGGFLVRGFRQRGRRPQALEFPDRDFPRLVSNAMGDDGTSPLKANTNTSLIPTGYEDLLRALGHDLDEASAESISITELQDVLVVSGRGRDEAKSAPGPSPFQKFLERDDIEYMLNEAFRRRGNHRPKTTRPVRESGGLRGILRRLN